MMKTFDRRVFFILASLVVLLGLVILAGQLSGLPAPELVQSAAGARGPLELRFSAAMDKASVESRLELGPRVAGRFAWDANTVAFWPDAGLAQGQVYTLRLRAGARSVDGQRLVQDVSWKVTIRPADVLYLAPSRAPELWRVSADGQTRVQLTQTGGRLFDYAVSPDGSRILYAARNEQRGLDLWEISRDGGEAVLVLPCQSDWCSTPAYSPDGSRVAYTRRQAALEGSPEPGPPRIWMLNLPGLDTFSLYLNPDIGGFDPAWSPDGRYLAFFDGLAGGMRVVNMESKEDFLVPSQMGMVGSWSPDSRAMLFVTYEAGGEQPYLPVSRIDVQTGQVLPLLGSEAEPAEYSVPVYSPDGAWLAVGMRPIGGMMGKQMYLLRSDGSELQAITSDPVTNFASYHWSPDGRSLVFQRFQLGSSDASPQIAAWERSTGAVTVLAEDAFLPNWIP